MTVKRADDEAYVLGTNLTATGNAVKIRGGMYMFYVSGTVGAATDIRLEILTPSGVWSRLQIYTGSIVSFTASQIPMAQTGIELPPGDVRVAIVGGAATAITSQLVGLG
jgi:hypothetical protein